MRRMKDTPSASLALSSMNCGMIATGNHADFDSLRGAPPQRGSQVSPPLSQLALSSMNCGMIATGNHADFDSLRGAPPQRGAKTRIISHIAPILPDSGICNIAFCRVWCYNDDGILYHAVVLPAGTNLPPRGKAAERKRGRMRGTLADTESGAVPSSVRNQRFLPASPEGKP